MALTTPHGQIFFVSKKEEDADELVRRAKFILENIPEEVIPKELRPQFRYTYCQLYFPDLDCYIRGIPQGADQLRQYAATAILLDEFAFMEKAEATYAALLPTTLAPNARGRLTMISTPMPNTLFHKIYKDELAK